MQLSEAYKYIIRSKRREQVLASLSQPLTAGQITRRTGLFSNSCRDIVRDLATNGLLECLNNRARRSRLYWLTALGQACQKRLSEMAGGVPLEHHVPAIDWPLYGWVCYRHRSVIIKTLCQPMQPATVKRKARAREANLRMSANNVRDVMRLFRRNGIVRPVHLRKKAHARYALTDTGEAFRRLLLEAEVPL